MNWFEKFSISTFVRSLWSGAATHNEAAPQGEATDSQLPSKPDLAREFRQAFGNFSFKEKILGSALGISLLGGALLIDVAGVQRNTILDQADAYADLSTQANRIRGQLLVLQLKNQLLLGQVDQDANGQAHVGIRFETSEDTDVRIKTADLLKDRACAAAVQKAFDAAAAQFKITALPTVESVDVYLKSAPGDVLGTWSCSYAPGLPGGMR